MERKFMRGYNHYWHAIDSLPSYMAKNLKEMPNNKGYRWKGVVFYGLLSEQRDQPQIVFEKSPQGLIIHEIRRDGSYKKILKPHGSKQNDKNSSYRAKYNDREVPSGRDRNSTAPVDRNNRNGGPPTRDRNGAAPPIFDRNNRNGTGPPISDRNNRNAGSAPDGDKKQKRPYTKPPQKKLLQIKKKV